MTVKNATEDKNLRPCAQYGFDAVGPGWYTILESLDSVINVCLSYDESSSITILQIKEKFGGLRVYFHAEEMDTREIETINGAIMLAEMLSFRTCEVCGSTENIDSRSPKNKKLGWIRTLCEEHHKEREENEGGSKL
jgi:hypothetical protein